MSHYVSNRNAAEEDLSRRIQKHLQQEATRFERLLDEEFRSPKTGSLIGKRAVLRSYARRVISGRGYVTRFNVRKTRDELRGPSRRGIKQRSGPGEAPAIQTAALRKGIAHRIERPGRLDWSIVIGVTIQSGRGGPQGKSGRSIADDLEFGTSKMQPRPGWRLALVKFMASYGRAR